MSQILAISLGVLIAALVIGATLLKAALVQICRLNFGVEPGVRDPEARRRYRAFEWYCWKAYGCGSAIYSMQEFKDPPFNWLADFSRVVTPIQWLLALAALVFAVAAVNRFRKPFAY